MNSTASNFTPVPEFHCRRLRAALAGVLVLGGVSCGSRLSAQQTPPPPAPNVVTTPVPPPVTLPGPPAPAPEAPNRPLTANEAALIALRLQPNIAAAQAAITAARGVTQQVRAGLMPTVSLGASYTYTLNLHGRGAANASSVSGTATLQQLIYDFNHIRDLVKQDLALERAQLQNLFLTQQETVFDVKQAFYQYVQGLQLVDVNAANVTNRQNQLALANARYKIGLGLSADVVTAQTALSEAIQNLTQARDTAETGRVNLALLMGIDPRTPIQPAPSSEAVTSSNDVNGFVQQALRQRPEILQAQATIEANRHALSAAKTFNAPVLAGTVETETLGNQFFPQNNSLLMGVSLSFPIFDGGQTAGLVKQARGNLASAQAQLRSAQITVTSDVSQAYLNLRSAQQRVSQANDEVTNAQEGIRIATGRYRAGLGLFQDILTAQQNLYTAQQDQATAQYALEQAAVALARATGAPLTGAQ